MENSVEVPQKIKNRIIMQSRSSIPQIQQYLSEKKKKTHTISKKVICTPMFNTALFTIAEIGKQPMCPLIDEQIKKMWYMWYT